MEIIDPKSAEQFFKAILSLKSEEECRTFFSDLCTIKELQDMTQRLDVAVKLNEGLSYQEISKETGVSSATISRVNRCLIYGDGGYRAVLDAMKGGNDE